MVVIRAPGAHGYNVCIYEDRSISCVVKGNEAEQLASCFYVKLLVCAADTRHDHDAFELKLHAL